MISVVVVVVKIRGCRTLIHPSPPGVSPAADARS
jgi:hypothetical protein